MNENKINRLFPNASKSFINANRDTELHPMQQQQPKRGSLDRPLQGKVQGSSCFKIVFTVYALRPLDWDNNHVKELQDSVVNSGILHGDDWRILSGEVISKKARSKEEEKTVIELFKI